MRISLNVAGGSFACTGTLIHVLETVANTWTSDSLTWSTASNFPAIDTITFSGTSAGGYQTGAGGYARLRVLEAASRTRMLKTVRSRRTLQPALL